MRSEGPKKKLGGPPPPSPHPPPPPLSEGMDPPLVVVVIHLTYTKCFVEDVIYDHLHLNPCSFCSLCPVDRKIEYCPLVWSAHKSRKDFYTLPPPVAGPHKNLDSMGGCTSDASGNRCWWRKIWSSLMIESTGNFIKGGKEEDEVKLSRLCKEY